MTAPARSRRSLGLPVAFASAVLLSPIALASFACATSSDDLPAIDDVGGVLPSVDAGEASADADAAPVPCVVGNLCPAPTPIELGAIGAVAGRAKGDVWASATNGVLLHWNGTNWSRESTGTLATFSSLFLSADEVWGIAGALVMRRGAATNSERTMELAEASRGLSGIAVLPSGDVLVSHSPPFTTETTPMVLGRITDFENRVIEFEPDPVLEGTDVVQELAVRALHLVPGKALWLVGSFGMVARYPVSPLGPGVVLPVPSQATLLAAWGHDNQLWAAGNGGVILHYDGSQWSNETSGTTVALRAIFGVAPNDVWAAGDDGVVLHYDGQTWSLVSVGRNDGSMRSIWGSAPDDVWIGGDDGMFHWGTLP